MPMSRTHRLELGARIARAREHVEVAMLLAAEVARQDAAEGVPEALIARDLGVSRSMVRVWIGKDTK